MKLETGNWKLAKTISRFGGIGPRHVMKSGNSGWGARLSPVSSFQFRVSGFPWKTAKTKVGALLIVLFLLLFSVAAASEIPKKGDILPAMRFPAPPVKEDRGHLGVTGDFFELKDLSCRLVLIEIIGVYCPRCFEQMPLFNNLFKRIEKSLPGRVKMLGVTAGGTPMEAAYLRETAGYRYPVVPDETFALHKLLGEPRTPFTMAVDKTGKVLDTHLGVITDMEAYFRLLEKLSE